MGSRCRQSWVLSTTVQIPKLMEQLVVRRSVDGDTALLQIRSPGFNI